jgi:SAM-dependent methyltransferase
MKNVTMSGQKISFWDKARSALAIYRAHKNKIFSDAKSAVVYHKYLIGYLHEYTGLAPKGARILDLGCGQTATQTLLFNADGAKVTGVDIEVPTYKMSLPVFFKVIKLNGLERALKSLARHALFDKGFFIELSKEYGRAISFEDIDSRIMDAKSMSFDSSIFDFIFSTTVFEHIDDVPAAVKEVNRVLKNSGIAIISIHLFPSLSGGHCLEWIFPDQFFSNKVPPWDHLRDNKYPINAYLNKLTISQYREIFRRYTEIIKEETVKDGERFLSQDLELELSKKGFSKEDLLTRSVNFFIRKRTVAT